jgi:CheY-like chemotaxis protein
MANILAIGSNPTGRDTLALILEFGGHDYATASFLEEAVSQLRNNPRELVITGSNLIDTDPAYVADRLKQTHPKVPAMNLSNSGEMLQGADAGLAIPCSPAELIQSVENVLEKCYSDSASGEIAEEVYQ